MKKFLLAGAIALLAVSFTACSDDPNLENVPVPEVEVAPNTLSGVVSNMQGNAVSGATVKVGNETATTDAQGIYKFSDVKAGTYTITVEATGMVSVSDKIVVAESETTQNLIYNATLAKINTTDVNVTVDGGGEGSVESEALESNEEGKVDITVDVPANTVPEDTKISITPVYTDESSSVMAVKSRANDDIMLLGANLTCSNPNLTSLSQDIALTFALDGSIATSVETKMLVDGKWVDAPSAVTNGSNVVISANKFTTYALFIRTDVKETTTTEALTFKQSEWNNLYGNVDMPVGNAEYSYKAGTAINTAARNKLQGLLIEYIARIWGARVSTLTGSYPINVTLPVGTAISIKGAQQKTTISVTNTNTTVTATTYGTCAVQLTRYNRQHNGGSN